MNLVPTIQGAKPEQCDNANLTDHEQAKVVVPENYQPLSDMEIVVLNEQIVQDKFKKTSNAAGDCKVDPDGITETPPKGFWVFVWEAMHDLTLTILAICACVSLGIKIVTEDWGNEWYDGSGIAFSIVPVVLWSLLEMEEASADALLLSAHEASVKQRTKACYTDQSMNSRMGQTDASGLWMEEGCWIYIIQDANGRQWERSCRDFQIHHVQPD